MSWTYSNLKTAIQDYLESTETSFVSTIDNPFLVYRPDLMIWEDNYKNSKTGILYDSIENMPT